MSRRSDGLPVCPTCGATGRKCKRPSSHEAASWHIEREDLAALQCMCGICVAWLERRGKLPAALPPRRRRDDVVPPAERMGRRRPSPARLFAQEELPL